MRGAIALLRSIWRLGLAWYNRLFQGHRYNRLVLERVEGQPFLVLPQVFNPKLLRTGALLARTLNGTTIPRGSTVLDMGTGSGVGAVIAARWAGQVMAVDINPQAVRCARINVLLNRLEDRVEVLQGDLFDPVRGQKFDVILFNPPFYVGEPRDDLDKAWRSNSVLDRFASEISDQLAPGGHALVVLSTDGEKNGFLETFRANGLDTETVREFDLINEVVTVYRLSDPRGGSSAPSS